MWSLDKEKDSDDSETEGTPATTTKDTNKNNEATSLDLFPKESLPGFEVFDQVDKPRFLHTVEVPLPEIKQSTSSVPIEKPTDAVIAKKAVEAQKEYLLKIDLQTHDLASSSNASSKRSSVVKDSAKDKVKRQRLNGQSGIGEDFKAWKSETEMQQRQQYD